MIFKKVQFNSIYSKSASPGIDLDQRITQKTHNTKKINKKKQTFLFFS